MHDEKSRVLLMAAACIFSRFIMARFLRLRRKKPGYPLQPFLPLRGKKGFPLLSLARAPAANTGRAACFEEKIHREAEDW
jgi:hypothetical protein